VSCNLKYTSCSSCAVFLLITKLSVLNITAFSFTDRLKCDPTVSPSQSPETTSPSKSPSQSPETSSPTNAPSPLIGFCSNDHTKQCTIEGTSQCALCVGGRDDGTTLCPTESGKNCRNGASCDDAVCDFPTT
jgi:hypothetical protein